MATIMMTAAPTSGAGVFSVSKEECAQVFQEARDEVKRFMPPASTLTDAARRRILKRYAAAIEGHFVTWLTAAMLSGRSIEARFAASENAYVEIQEDHAGMLSNFVSLSGAPPGPEDFDYVAPYLMLVQAEVAKMSGLFLTTLLGILENTSTCFIPWLAEISFALGNTDLTYTDNHGEADILHADQFLWALEMEAAHYADPHSEIERAQRIALRFLRGILGGD